MTLAVGSELPQWVIESVSAEHMKTLAVVLADPNPIHLDPEAVKALGMGERVINQGPANVGYVLNMLAAAVPGAHIKDIKVRFLSNVFAGDRLIASGRVEEAEEGEEGGAGESVLRLSVWLDVVGGGRALDGTATLVL